tara:strand:- start:404 stop:991 length:588 start_codon:yes stop_codon:yes gene_type:complete
MDFYELKTWQKAKLFDKIMEDNFGEDGIGPLVLYDDGFEIELDAEEYFDKHIFSCKWVEAVESEVWGSYYRKINGVQPKVRIDRLIRTKCGKYVGVELKAGKMKIGKALNQIIDYTNSKFYSVRNMEDVFFPENGWVSTFPLSQQIGGPISSIIMQHRIARFTGEFNLMHGNDIIATPDDEKLRMNPPARKVGSR